MNKPTVFYVDDEQANLDAFELGAPDEWEVHTFINGQSALDAIESKKPSLIITDIMMQGMSGIDLIFAVRKLMKEINLVCLSGISKHEIIEKYGDMGDTPFYPKPTKTSFFEDIAHLAKPSNALLIPMGPLMLAYLKEYELKAQEYLAKKKINGNQSEGLDHYQLLFEEYRAMMNLSPKDDQILWQAWMKKYS